MSNTASRSSVLVLTSTYPRWKGDEEPPFVHELSRRLCGKFDMHVLAPHAPGSKASEMLDGVYVHRFRYAPDWLEILAYRGGILANLKKSPWVIGLAPFFLLTQLAAAVRLITSRHIQVIHAHWLFPQGLIALFSRALARRRVKVLCTSHGGDLYGLKGPVFKRIKRIVAAGCDHLTVVSQSMHGDLVKLGIDSQKISVIPMGVDLQHRFIPPSDPPAAQMLLFVGRLVEKKGLRYLLEAIPKIAERFPQVHLTIVGDGPDRIGLEKISGQLGLRGRVEFLGALPNERLPCIYQRAGIVVFPSVVSGDGDREGFGLVLVEAIGCGCVTVVTDLPAMMDIVQDGKTAIVVRQKRPNEIASAVIRILSNPKLKSSMVFEGRQHVIKNFDWESIALDFRGKIEKMLNS